jgi:hypothetical protein
MCLILKTHFLQKEKIRLYYGGVMGLNRSRTVAQAVVAGGPSSSPGLVMWDLWRTKWG